MTKCSLKKVGFVVLTIVFAGGVFSHAFAGEWEKPWSSVKGAAAQSCAKTFQDFQLQAVCMENEKKGYDKNWIDKRMRGMSIRQSLTDEWAERGAKKSIDYAILTNDIMQKEIKGLERENLRDHMTDLELIITMLGEATTTQITQQQNSMGIEKLRGDAKVG